MQPHPLGAGGQEQAPGGQPLTDEQRIASLTDDANRILRAHADDGTVYGSNPAYERSRLADVDYVDSRGDEVFVHGGLNRMTGLLQMVENANESGKPLPFIRMRDDASQPIHIHTQSRMRPILDALAQRKNAVESAHNKVMQAYHSLARIRDNTALTTNVRLAHANYCLNFLNDYKAKLEAELAAYDPDELPTDVEDLRDLYVERIEATALARAKDFRQALTEQGVKIGDSCDDERDAIRRVALAERNAAIDILSADDATEMKTAYDAGLASIAAVVPANIPEFLIGGTPLGANPSNQQVSVASLTVWCDHPVDAAITRPVGLGFAISKDGAKYRNADRKITVSRSTLAEGETRRGVTLGFDASLSGQVFDIDFTGRSPCGQSRLKVRVIVASS